MNDTRKSRMIIVLAANLALSAVIGFAIWNGGDSAKHVIGVEQPPGVKAGSESNSATEAAISVALHSDLRNYPATTRSDAAAQARQLAGCSDPMSCPSYKAPYASEQPLAADENILNPPLKKASLLSALKSIHLSKETVKVPLPSLPVPTERNPASPVLAWKYTPPSKMAGITVTAVIGNKAMLSLRPEGIRRQEQPQIICLAPGEKVRTADKVPVSVIAVEPYRVTLDVGGERYVKSLPEIR